MLQFQDITVEELLELQRKGDLTIVDVRSPSEYEEGTIPGSVNIPLFDDEERAEVGTLYKQVSTDAAKDKGLELVSRKLPAFIKTFETNGNRSAVFCWRGGMRSRTSATLLALMGMRVFRLEGGFRAYRKWVVSTLEEMQFRGRAYVINGNTGSGKTKILQRLAELGYPMFDLEEMAGHRGSIFGQIGLKPNNQKTFESLLVQDLLKWKDSPFFLMEAESKRIGKAVMPEFLVQAKEKGVQLFIEMPVSERVRIILEDYRPLEHKEECIRAFEFIEQRIHTPIAAEIREHLEADRFDEAVALLLEHYYDPRYEHATGQYGEERITIRARNVDEAVEGVIRHLPPKPMAE